jgi:hypothetical protein
MITTKLGSGVAGKALPSATIEDVSVYFPLEERAAVYQVTSGPNAGKSQKLGLAKVRRPSGELAWRFQFSPTPAGFVHETEQGDLMIPAVGDMEEGVVVITTPANPFMLKGMKLGESRSYTQHHSYRHRLRKGAVAMTARTGATAPDRPVDRSPQGV